MTLIKYILTITWLVQFAKIYIYSTDKMKYLSGNFLVFPYISAVSQAFFSWSSRLQTVITKSIQNIGLMATYMLGRISPGSVRPTVTQLWHRQCPVPQQP